jgi:hypothetical protein
MLWWQLSAIFANFWRKKLAFFSKKQCYDQHFALFSFALSQKRQFLKSQHRSQFFKQIFEPAEKVSAYGKVCT